MKLKLENDQREEKYRKALSDIDRLYDVHGAAMVSRGEMRSDPNTLQRWQCRGKGMIGRHPVYWGTANDVIEHGEKGELACPICREIAQMPREVITFQELVDGVAEQEKREEKSLQKSRAASRRGGYVDKYAVGGPA